MLQTPGITWHSRAIVAFFERDILYDQTQGAKYGCLCRRTQAVRNGMRWDEMAYVMAADSFADTAVYKHVRGR